MLLPLPAPAGFYHHLLFLSLSPLADSFDQLMLLPLHSSAALAAAASFAPRVVLLAER